MTLLTWGALGIAISAALVFLTTGTGRTGAAYFPDPVALKVQGPDTVGNPQWTAIVAPGTPGGFQTPVSSSANAAASANVATLPGVAAKTTFISGFTCTAAGSTAALAVNVTITGTISGTLNYTFVFPAGVTLNATPLNVEFAPPLAASAVNTAIVVTLPSGGAGNTNAAVSAWGYQQ